MAKGESKTGNCRFCGQSSIIEGGADMTAPQLEEAATMQCTCEKAMAYQETANRRTVAKQRVEELFGKDAGEYAQPDDTLAYILAGIDQVCDKKAKQIIITIKTSLRARIMQMAKDKIKVVRETSNTDEFTQ